MKSPMQFDKLEDGVDVSRSDRPGEVDMSFDKASGTFKAAANLPADVTSDYDARKAESQQRLTEIADRKRAEDEAAGARAAAEAAARAAHPGAGPGSA